MQVIKHIFNFYIEPITPGMVPEKIKTRRKVISFAHKMEISLGVCVSVALVLKMTHYLAKDNKRSI